MNCPKCNSQIGENDLVCPSCKKVLKLQCHKCGHVTKNAVCEKCGTTIINKCYKCGRLNSAALEVCPSCGMNINASIGLRESVIEEFAALTVEVENADAIQDAFKSEKLAMRFMTNFYEMVKKIASEKKLRVQRMGNTFIIRFCKDFSFPESCISAMDFSIYIAQSVTEINRKLYEAKGVTIKAKMAVQKRDVFSKPSEYKSGVNINLIYTSKKVDHLLSHVQVVVDSYIYQSVKTRYPFQSLSAVYIKNQMVMFFELMLPQIIKAEQEEEAVDGNLVELPKNLDFEPEEDVDEKRLINFSNLHCSFLKSKYELLPAELSKIINSEVKNPIIAVKSSLRAGGLTGLYRSDFESLFPNTRVCRFACPKNGRYSPFGFFKDLIYSYTNVAEPDLFLRPELVSAVTPDIYLQNLLLAKVTPNKHPEDLRFEYFESFVSFFNGIAQKTVFVVDNFENIDEGSLEILKYLIENRNLGNTGFIFQCDENFSIHRKIYKLMTSENFFEIELKLSSNKRIVEEYHSAVKDIEKTFFFEKILENTKGSHFYYTQAFNYLLDNKIFSFKNGKYEVENNKMIVLPSTLEDMAKKRIQSLSSKKNALELYTEMILTGEKIPVDYLQMLGYDDLAKLLKHLTEIKMIQVIDDRIVGITNYNLFRSVISEAVETERLQGIAGGLIEKVLNKVSVDSRIKAEVLELAGCKKESFAEWNKMAVLASGIGDFPGYLNCTNKYLSLVDNVIDEGASTTVEQVRLEVYEEMSTLLYKYYPEKIMNFLELLLENLEADGDDVKIKTVANKLVQSCLLSGNYTNALEYVGKIISRTPTGSFNPASGSFNLNYFLINLVTLEIYFNLGRLNECIELGEELFRYISPDNIMNGMLPEGFSKKQFKDAIIDALFFISLSRILQLKPDAGQKIQQLLPLVPSECSCFQLLIMLIQFMQGADISRSLASMESRDFVHDKYAQIVYPILRGFCALKKQAWDELGNYFYQSKLVASSVNMHQIEHFCDLMIGYAYQQLGNLKKAKQIYYNVLDTSSTKGIKNITYFCWYLVAQTEILDRNIENSLGILNNALLSMDKDENISDYFILLFKKMSADILFSQGEDEKALFCANQAFEIGAKNGLFINLPSIAGLLTQVYQKLISIEKNPNAVQFYKMKLQELASLGARVKG